MPFVRNVASTALKVMQSSSRKYSEYHNYFHHDPRPMQPIDFILVPISLTVMTGAYIHSKFVEDAKFKDWCPFAGVSPPNDSGDV